jgi:hypothetical protein
MAWFKTWGDIRKEILGLTNKSLTLSSNSCSWFEKINQLSIKKRP